MGRFTLALVMVTLLIAGLLPVTVAAGTPPCRVVKFNAAGRAVGVFTSPQDAISPNYLLDTGSTLQITGSCVGPIYLLVSMNLVGRGRATLDGGGHGAVLSTDPGTTINVTNLTITNGHREQGIGGIINFGDMHLTNSVVTGNSGCVGGIANAGTLTIENSTISGNSGPYNCGGPGIFNQQGQHAGADRFQRSAGTPAARAPASPTAAR